MSAGFTPGPWSASIEARPAPASGHWYVIMDDAEDGLGEFYGPNHEENVANANLAAAAPDLYVELDVRSSDLHMLRRAIEEGDPKAELLVRVGDMIRETKDALAKARGETK